MSSLSRDSSFLHRTNAKTAESPNPVDSATSILSDPMSKCQHDDEPIPDPYTYYRAFLSSDVPCGDHTRTLPSSNDSVTNLAINSSTPSVPELEGPQHSRPRNTSYSLAVRFANRSNGAPLATIVEQGSASTLNSHRSLPSVGRFPSIRAVENVSPGRGPKTARQSLEERLLGGIQEEARQEQDTDLRNDVTDIHPEQRRGGSDPLHNVVISAQPGFEVLGKLDSPQLPEIEHDLEHNGLRRFLRGVLQNVRSGSRSRSRSRSHSSSLTDVPEAQTAAQRRPDPGHFSPCVLLHEVEGTQKHSAKPETLPVVTSGDHCSSVDALSLLANPAATHATIRKSAGTDEPSAGVCPPKPHLPPPSTHQNADADLSSFRTSGEAALTVRSVPPALRDSTPDHVLANATTLPHRNRDEFPTQNTVDGGPFYHLDAHCSRDVDRGRDISQNASFCSTMSTSYSGTVLGVDLDLQHERPQSDHRSLTPLWFTPIESKDRNRAQKVPSAPQAQEQRKHTPSRSMTSSALSALLPIAAAEGIVRPNYKTPQLSFFSPSGNLIQTENAAPPPTSPAHSPLNTHYPGTPTISTSYYNNTESPAYDALSAAIGLPPARPAPVPMTTPPQSSAPLPYHLRHHHNYQHPELSQITSEADSESYPQSIIRPGSAIKGCGGVIRRASLTPRSGTPFAKPSSKQKLDKSERSMSCMTLGEASKSRFNILSSWPSPSLKGKGNTLKKRERNEMPCSQHHPRTHRRGESGVSVGSAAGHAMRVLFCQPYDGAGTSSADTGCGRIPIDDHCSEVEARRKVRDSATPNVRIVDGEEAGANSADNVDGKAKEDRPGSTHVRARSDSGVSTGAAVRIGVVGA
ncbi:hypothetical protein P280DRAFT_271782 [Massarina eburnea CBS 473.64]|uniref:Uncharacterized protein n=1 Tax=Massarina eburnea CBS 473.64 TaxID=1395130 RepID=A0A6A6S681_9PLEO|nr:hypothetical protein P280DRAFT_271782 [Massarina eburnea CBS 473.64]